MRAKALLKIIISSHCSWIPNGGTELFISKHRQYRHPLKERKSIYLVMLLASNLLLKRPYLGNQDQIVSLASLHVAATDGSRLREVHQPGQRFYLDVKIFRRRGFQKCRVSQIGRKPQIARAANTQMNEITIQAVKKPIE